MAQEMQRNVITEELMGEDEEMMHHQLNYAELHQRYMQQQQ